MPSTPRQNRQVFPAPKKRKDIGHAQLPAEPLMVLERGVAALAKAGSLEDIKEIRDQAEAVRKYAQNARRGLELQNAAAELRIRAERRAGEFLRTMEFRGGDRRSCVCNSRLTLDELGITQNQSTRWQRLAKIPEDHFTAYLASSRNLDAEITTAGLFRSVSMRVRERDLHFGSPSARDELLSIASEDGQSSPLVIVGDLLNHIHAVDDTLSPLYEGGDPAQVHPCQGRYLHRLMLEITALLTTLRKILVVETTMGEKCVTP